LSNISEDMRQILIDWLIDVHSSFDLKEQTLHLAFIYLNRYSSTTEITKHDYQLVGVACLWIASKYEEIYPPRMHNYIQVTDSSYSTTELKAMEGKILLALNFNLTYTTPLAILEAVSDKWQK
jgi:cyclin B